MRTRALAVAAALAALTGCYQWHEVSTGVAVPLTAEERPSAAIEARYGYGDGTYAQVTAGAALRSKVNADFFQLAFGPQVCWTPSTREVELMFMTCGGASLFQVEAFDERGWVGVGSPWLRPSVLWVPEWEHPFGAFGLALPVEYDVRFGTKNRWFLGLQLTVGGHTRISPPSCNGCAP